MTVQYRPVVTVSNSSKVQFALYLDSFFDLPESATNFAQSCIYQLEKSFRTGEVTFAVRDKNKRVAARIKRNQIIKYDCIVDKKPNSKTFEDLFAILKDNESDMTISFDLEKIGIEAFSFKDE